MIFLVRKASGINKELVSHQLIGSSVVKHTPNVGVQIQLSNPFNVFGHVSEHIPRHDIWNIYRHTCALQTR
jgi:translation initiation factor IF-1